MPHFCSLGLINTGAVPVKPAFAQNTFRNDQFFTRESGNGGQWGSWTKPVYCPPGSWAAGYTMRVEPDQGRGDDTGLNAIALYCRDRNGRDIARIMPHPGMWGNWGEGSNCPQGVFLTHFQLKVEVNQGSGDDTAANSVRFMCGNQRPIESSGTPWGNWGPWQGSYNGVAICGVRAKVEPEQGKGDDTALNDLDFTWCKI
ncbi:hypothetical protein PN450_10830 [Dolichospermum lemmermannii CS-548]|nr:hypothetical protein [Dolichospermum lemmermannii CS-548]